ncbi:hypothetical protein C8Q75DRAFT_736301 [Abortiporus biennis]|nr:hypothetical protein C8Q75DRAFT_736301 [Abortiporus biennis]
MHSPSLVWNVKHPMQRLHLCREDSNSTSDQYYSIPTTLQLITYFPKTTLFYTRFSTFTTLCIFATIAIAAPVDVEERGVSHNNQGAGSAYSVHTGNVNGGSISNSGGFVYNVPFTNTAGRGGYSGSGIAVAGNDNGGGSAYSGSTSDSDAYGGSISNSGASTALTRTLQERVVFRLAVLQSLEALMDTREAYTGKLEAHNLEALAVLMEAVFTIPVEKSSMVPSLTLLEEVDTPSREMLLQEIAADGGSVYNSGGTVINGFGSNTAGKGGVSSSGAAIAGSTHGYKRGFHGGQAGSAYSGSTGSVNGGSIYNSGGKVINGPFSNTAGRGGYSISGDAIAGNGVGGGNAYSGSAGSAEGGSVYNTGGTVINGFGSNTASNGGVSRRCNAIAGGTH